MPTKVAPVELDVTPAEWVETEGLLPVDVLAALCEGALHKAIEQGHAREEFPTIGRDDVLEAMKAAHGRRNQGHIVGKIGPFAIEASLDQLAGLHGFDAAQYDQEYGAGAAREAIDQAYAALGIEKPEVLEGADETRARLREQLSAGATDAEAATVTSDEPIEQFLLGGTGKLPKDLRAIRERALGLIGQMASADDRTFEALVKPYLDPEFREGDGWIRAKAALTGYRRRLIAEQTREHEAWAQTGKPRRRLRWPRRERKTDQADEWTL